jgi:hypothetical protein
MTYTVSKLIVLACSTRVSDLIGSHKDSILTMFLLFPCPDMLIKHSNKNGAQDIFAYEVLFEFWENAKFTKIT